MGSLDFLSDAVNTVSGSVQGVWVAFREWANNPVVDAFGKFVDAIENAVGIDADPDVSGEVTGSVNGIFGSSAE
jgi:uncharacterized protein YoxC